MPNTDLTPEQMQALNEAAAQAMELYVDRIRGAFPDLDTLRTALASHMHMHTGVMISDKQEPLLGLRVIIAFMSPEELTQQMADYAKAQGEQR